LIILLSTSAATYPNQSTEDVVDGSHRRQRHIEDGKLALEPVGNIILATTWNVHGSKVPAPWL